MHEKYHYRTLEEVKARAENLNAPLPFAQSTDALTKPVTFRGRTRSARCAAESFATRPAITSTSTAGSISGDYKE